MGNSTDFLQVGRVFSFNGLPKTKYGLVCRINDDRSVDYIRESLTRWTCDPMLLETGKEITKEYFIDMVKSSARKSSHKIPSSQEVEEAINLFIADFDIDYIEIFKALNL